MNDRFIKLIFTDPVYFFEYATNKKPYDYQCKFLRCEDKRITVRAGRQCGKSTMITVKALFDAIMNPNYLILIIGAYQKQANEDFYKIKEYINMVDFVKMQVERETLTQIEFKNKSRILCLPAGRAGASIRGYSPQLIIFDEAAFASDRVYEAIEPSVAVTKGGIILTSNTFGKSGFFYESFDDASGFTKFHVKASDCPGFSKEDLERLKRTKPEIVYAQEYDAEFIEEADNYFNMNLIKQCINDEIEINGPEGDKEYIMGVDLARMGTDSSVFMIGELSDDKIFVRKIIATMKKPATDAIGRIKDLHRVFDFKRIYVDESSIGGAIYDILEESELPIIPCKFFSHEKSELFKSLKLQMEQKKIFYPNNQQLVTEMANLKYSFTSNGLLSLKPPAKGHDDMVDALALVCKHFNTIKYDQSGDDFPMKSG